MTEKAVPKLFFFNALDACCTQASWSSVTSTQLTAMFGALAAPHVATAAEASRSPVKSARSPIIDSSPHADVLRVSTHQDADNTGRLPRGARLATQPDQRGGGCHI